VAREWCVVVEPAGDATPDETRLIEFTLQMHRPPFEYESEDGRFLLFADDEERARRVAAAVADALAESGVDFVDTPLPVGEWSDDARRWVFDDDEEEAEPAVPFDEIGWLVTVRPRSPFEWRDVRDELAARRRTILRETEDALEVAARDEDDAAELAHDLARLGVVAGADAEKLGRLRRWQVRQTLLGNYSGRTDPGGGDGGFDSGPD